MSCLLVCDSALQSSLTEDFTCFIYFVPSEVVLLSELSDPVVLPAPGQSVLVLIHTVPAQPVTVRVELDVPDVVTLPAWGRIYHDNQSAGRIVIFEAFFIFKIYIKYEIFGRMEAFNVGKETV